MPRLSTRLLRTERACHFAKPLGSRTEYRVVGARNLLLRVDGGGSKTWAYLFKSPVTGTWRKISLGNHPTLSMQQAKSMAFDCLAAVRMGRDPLTRTAVVPTFKEISSDYVEAHKLQHSVSRQGVVRQALKRDILPTIGRVLVDSVTKRDVAAIMERVISRGSPAAANECLKVTRAIYRWAVCTGRCELDPTLGLRATPSKPRERVLSDAELRLIWNIPTVFMKPYRLQLLTAARIGEVISAEKAEFDLDGRTWVIPASRSKNGRSHSLPLSDAAVAVVQSAGSNRWLFPNHSTGEPLRAVSAPTTLRRIQIELGIESRFTPHDLRRTVATRIGDLGFPDDVVERILNHTSRTTSRRHYNHSTRLPEMKAALDAWAIELQRIVS